MTHPSVLSVTFLGVSSITTTFFPRTTILTVYGAAQGQRDIDEPGRIGSLMSSDGLWKYLAKGG